MRANDPSSCLTKPIPPDAGRSTMHVERCERSPPSPDRNSMTSVQLGSPASGIAVLTEREVPTSKNSTPSPHGAGLRTSGVPASGGPSSGGFRGGVPTALPAGADGEDCWAELSGSSMQLAENVSPKMSSPARASPPGRGQPIQRPRRGRRGGGAVFACEIDFTRYI